MIARDGTSGLVPRIEDEITRVLTQPMAAYDGFESYWDLRDKVTGVGAELKSLSRYTNRDLTAAQRAQFQALRKQKISDVLRLEAYRPAPELLSIRLDVYSVPERDDSPSIHRSAQWVAPCGAPDEQALDLLHDAVSCLATGGCDAQVAAHIDVSPGPVVGMNERVTLDGCASRNERQDALRWQWVLHRTGSGVAPVTSGGRRWTTPLGLPGEYAVELRADTELRPEGSIPGDAFITLRATIPPVANAGPSRQLDIAPGSAISIALDGSASVGAESYRWEQLSGPIGSFDGALFCETAHCTFAGPFSGVYEFRLTVRNGPFKSTDDTTVLVNPHVDVHIDTLGVKHMFPHRAIRLRAVTSVNELDRSPLVSWQITSAPTSIEGALLDAPSEPETRFIPRLPGHYVIELVARSRKQVGNRELWADGHDTVDVEVNEPVSFLYGDVSAHFPVGADQVHTTFVPMLHFLTLFGVNSSIGARYSIGIGAEDLVRGPTLDLEGSLDLVSRRILQNNLQSFAYAGYFGARHDERDQIDHGIEAGWINVIKPLGYPIFTDFSVRWVVSHDMHVLFGLSLGLGGAVATEID